MKQHDDDERLAAAAAADGRRERVEQPGVYGHMPRCGTDALQAQQRVNLPACKRQFYMRCSMTSRIRM